MVRTRDVIVYPQKDYIFEVIITRRQTNRGIRTTEKVVPVRRFTVKERPRKSKGKESHPFGISLAFRLSTLTLKKQKYEQFTRHIVRSKVFNNEGYQGRPPGPHLQQC
jgi:hypothetical protein